MKYINNLIIGSGISSFIYSEIVKQKQVIYTGKENKVLQSNNLYEYDSVGGNSNIWGGYINFKRHKKFLKNKRYKEIFEKNLFKINKIFKINSKFTNTYCITDKNKNIFRVDKKLFKGNLIEKKIFKISIKKNNIRLTSEDNKTIFVKKLILCAGNLNLIKLLYQSNLIYSTDIISFDDGPCNYVLNIFINQKKNYYIPMPLIKIFEKLLFKKSKLYKISNDSFILQKFSNKINKHKILCENLLKLKEKKIRYFLSNHVTNLRINNIPIRKFIKSKSKRINVFSSGTIKKYLPGPIIQDLIFDILINK
jgi:hypothetical protein